MSSSIRVRALQTHLMQRYVVENTCYLTARRGIRADNNRRYSPPCALQKAHAR